VEDPADISKVTDHSQATETTAAESSDPENPEPDSSKTKQKERVRSRSKSRDRKTSSSIAQAYVHSVTNFAVFEGTDKNVAAAAVPQTSDWWNLDVEEKEQAAMVMTNSQPQDGKRRMRKGDSVLLHVSGRDCLSSSVHSSRSSKQQQQHNHRHGRDLSLSVHSSSRTRSSSRGRRDEKRRGSSRSRERPRKSKSCDDDLLLVMGALTEPEPEKQDRKSSGDAVRELSKSSHGKRRSPSKPKSKKSLSSSSSAKEQDNDNRKTGKLVLKTFTPDDFQFSDDKSVMSFESIEWGSGNKKDGKKSSSKKGKALPSSSSKKTSKSKSKSKTPTIPENDGFGDLLSPTRAPKKLVPATPRTSTNAGKKIKFVPKSAVTSKPKSMRL